MLRSVDDFKDYTIHATDGNIGHVKDLYFDDKTWVIRYLIVDTGGWLSSRKVLISPIGIGKPNWGDRVLPVSITKEQVKNSPDIDTDKPVSRQHEVQFLGYYNYPYYWGGASIWGESIYPDLMMMGADGLGTIPLVLHHDGKELVVDGETGTQATDQQEEGDPHLRSCSAVMGYHVEASDGEVGEVSSFLVDEETWAIRYMVVETGSWWSGHQVLLSPQWIRDVRWTDTTVSINLNQQTIKDAPAYDPTRALTREQEAEIYRHYRQTAYWDQQAERVEVLSPD